jgi:uncharacterized membrane protein
MSKAETIIRCMNTFLMAGLLFIPIFTGLFKTSKMPVREGLIVTSVGYLIAFIVIFVGIQFALK